MKESQDSSALLMLAALAERAVLVTPPESQEMTLGTFWTEVAHLGGYLARVH